LRLDDFLLALWVISDGDASHLAHHNRLSGVCNALNLVKFKQPNYFDLSTGLNAMG
jgi:hypothetical protein